MAKLRLFAFSAVLALTLTACTAGTASPSPSVSPSPVESLPPAQEEHLEFYDQFDRYNNSIDEHDFVISETEVDGKLQYQFQNEEHGVTVFASPRGKTEPLAATLAYQEKTLKFEMPIFILGYGNVSGVASLHLDDLTGDNMPELIYIYGAGGTGVWEDKVKVFDLSTMTECPVIWDNDALSELVQITPVELRDTDETYHKVVYAVTGPDGQTVYGADLTKETVLPKCAAAWFGGYECIGLNDGTLTLATCFSSDLSLPSSYVGDLRGTFAYDAETASFTLDTILSMALVDPVDAPAGP